jgi:hypothetical protein
MPGQDADEHPEYRQAQPDLAQVVDRVHDKSGETWWDWLIILPTT